MSHKYYRQSDDTDAFTQACLNPDKSKYVTYTIR